ncbi:MAG: PID-CTERM protein-sorting domain-containing protein [Flavipsychrobacter sp.]|jgi:hypothetical protein|nr:hypothetical protein [Chitinophagales bacterium]
MKQKEKIIAFVLFLVIVSTTVYAQGPGFDDDVVDEVPIDGGVGALLIGGIAYGVKKLKDRKSD